MPHKFEFVNLFSVEQAIPARAVTRTRNESEFLIKVDRVPADTGQRRGLADVNRLSHVLKG